MVPRHGRETVGRGRGRCAGQVLPPYQSSLAVGACHHAATFRQEPATGARALISRSVWLMLPRRSCSAGWVSAMSFADKTKRSHPVAPTRLPAYSDPLGRSVRALHCLRRTRRSTAGRWIVILRRRRRVKNDGQPPPHQHGAGVSDLLPGAVPRSAQRIHRRGQAGSQRQTRGVGQRLNHHRLRRHGT